MFWNRLFATKTLEMLDAEAKGDNRLRRVLGPIGLTSLGVGAIIGAGIFVITGRVAATDAGPGILLSFVVAGIACALAAFCYAEFASMAPVAGSAYTYAYATLGEIFAWIIGWDLILEYAMSAATVAAVWAKYLNKLLKVIGVPEVPEYLCNDPFSTPGAWFNLPAVLILMAVTAVLVIGIRESAASNTALVMLKLSVVVFVIVVGVGYVSTKNWFDIDSDARKTPEQVVIPGLAAAHAELEANLLKSAEDWTKQFDPKKKEDDKAGQKKEDDTPARLKVTVDSDKRPTKTLERPLEEKKGKTIEVPVADRAKLIKDQALAVFMKRRHEGKPHWEEIKNKHEPHLPTSAKDKEIVEAVLKIAGEKAPEKQAEKWGMVGQIGINKTLEQIDDSTRSNFMPYGISGVMLGAALVFFAFIGFDSISTHSEEAIKPQRDVPIGIIASLGLCTVLYVLVAGVITGMVPYWDIEVDSAVASAFTEQKDAAGQQSPIMRASGGLIAAGALAGMTSVLLITFLSQARIFLAMARDGMMPEGIFGAVHEKFKTPHISTMLTGTLMSIVAAFTPILKLEEMVNIGTLFAFVVVCAAVLILRIKRPEAPRPFKCPLVFVVAPAGIVVNLMLMFFLPSDTWWRLVIWLGIGMCIYFAYGYRNSVMRHVEAGEKLPGSRPLPPEPTSWPEAGIKH
jgi:amino acid transporter